MNPEKSKETPLTLVVSVFALALFVLMRTLDAPLLAKGYGIVALEFAGTPEHALHILRAWGSSGQAAAYQSLWWDFLFMLAYGGALVLLIRGVARRSKQIPQALTWCMKGFVVAAVILDVTENMALLQVMQGNIEAWVAGAWWCAAFKFGALGVVFLYLISSFRLKRKETTI
ncbi:MAG TPA: hypothetical protein DIW24_06760 [Bacteroidetes bacterium]|nr:hypothetical protein [Bacteroidota bacterium]HRR10157.1 hypothetical protein [Rhodothermales bacterium]